MRCLLICAFLILAVNAGLFDLALNKETTEVKDLAPTDAESGEARHIPPGANEEGLVVRSKRYYGCGCCGGCCGCGCNCATMAPGATMAPCGCYGCCG